MPRYDYVAYDSGGAPKTGSVNAADRDEAMADLRRRGLAVSELVPKMTAIARGGSGGQDGLSRAASWFVARRRLRTRDLATMARSLAVTQSTGVPTFRAVSMLSEELRGSRIGETLAQMEADVAEGASLSEAMRNQEHRIGAVACAIVESGEATGQLAPALQRLADMLDSQVRLQRKLWSAASHPLFTMGFAVVVFVVMVLFIVPTFETIYEDFDADLPQITASVVAVSRLALRFFYLIPVGVVAAVAGYLWMMELPWVRAWRDRLLLGLPLVGDLVRDAALSRIVSVVASAMAVGVPLLQGLILARGVAGNTEYVRAVQRARDAVSDGSALYPVIAGDPAFPPLLRQVVKVGEESATLPDMLGRYAATLDAAIESTADRVVNLTEILLILVVGSMVAFMLVVLYLPVFSLAGLL